MTDPHDFSRFDLDKIGVLLLLILVVNGRRPQDVHQLQIEADFMSLDL
ncbi:hypothetical protein F442_22373 [Phytophthora nicotianae P10297]|uniref:Uncharacterized protein n=2 Tax=Phytophthora nicotianae TaxID=4792 RepID=W2Y2B1_PHYNI|nr:hypothetical protein F444_22347 [Phytophthora nicotianae P1976]ETP28334.1 hypothetical protein F442_22373 [Phytophthora nicotianae P10297]